MNHKRAKKLWRTVNRRYFNAALTMPEFIKFSGSGHSIGAELQRGEACHGAYSDNQLCYHRKLKGKLLKGTIAHEMIHQYQEQILKMDLHNTPHKIAHGATFKPHAKVMKRDGLKI